MAIGVRSKNKNNDRTPESSKESSNRNNRLSDSEDLDKNENRKPVAYAGPEQIVYEGSKITLEGSCNLDSEKHPNRDISYAWELEANHTNISMHADLIIQILKILPFMPLTSNLTLIKDKVIIHTRL